MLDVCEFKHYRIHHPQLFADKQNHIYGVEKIWTQAKRLSGVSKGNFVLLLKEWKWHFNNPDLKAQLKQLKQWIQRFLNELFRTVQSYLGGQNEIYFKIF